ncbi:NADPH-dependent FMN reductase [Nocardioides sp. SYSU D00038]|uniref:NADPH-dependent FMN reductase n=1 Tax=Nocardioides sp. SYSU D00038 TaxID=2812554 RepID=UPI001967C179|nr:NAD(P)H-dependent oxidoreductase [Nocardioides sp. SYSU D00038]
MTNPQAPDPVTVALIVGSGRDNRFADALLPWLRAELGARAWLRLDVVDVARRDDDPSPRLDAADAFVVLTPEYNHSFPGSLKELIDRHRAEWQFKPVGFVSYGAASGGIRAVEQLRQVFAELYATTARNGVQLSAPWQHVDQDDRFRAPESARAALDATLTELHWWALALRDARGTHGVPVG